MRTFSLVLLPFASAVIWGGLPHSVAAQPLPAVLQKKAMTGVKMVRIPAGHFQPLYGSANTPRTPVAAFAIDRDPVTRGAYLAFVQQHPAWQRASINPLFADTKGYLSEWSDGGDPGSALDRRRPVTSVSWFAARAYCAALGKRLPTVNEWELVASASSADRNASRDVLFIQQLVQLYALRTIPVPPIERGVANAYGVRGMHSLAWEWVEDYNSVLVSDDSRGVGARDHDLYCASAAIGAVDPSNYAAFLRYAVRSGATGRSTLLTLGFRCAAGGS